MRLAASCPGFPSGGHTHPGSYDLDACCSNQRLARVRRNRRRGIGSAGQGIPAGVLVDAVWTGAGVHFPSQEHSRSLERKLSPFVARCSRHQNDHWRDRTRYHFVSGFMRTTANKQRYEKLGWWKRERGGKNRSLHHDNQILTPNLPNRFLALVPEASGKELAERAENAARARLATSGSFTLGRIVIRRQQSRAGNGSAKSKARPAKQRKASGTVKSSRPEKKAKPKNIACGSVSHRSL